MPGEREPIIALSCSMSRGDSDFHLAEGASFEYLKRGYHQIVERFGGIPLPIVNSADEATLRRLIELSDGLLLTGGDDPDPSFWGEENLYPEAYIHIERDRAEIALVRIARKMGIPVLGVCRGIQIACIAFGGTMYQDLSLRPGTHEHRRLQSKPTIHEVTLKRGTTLHRIAGTSRVEVNSTHHQMVRDLPQGFRPCALAPDGVVEAMEWMEKDWWFVGVQWHPELLADTPLTTKLLTEFIKQSAAYGNRKKRPR